MPLPDPLPTDPDALEALYHDLVAQDTYNQEDFDRLMDARLRSWGLDPEHLTAAQLIGAMQESMNRMLLNLRMAMGAAPDEDSEARLAEVVRMAEQLSQDIDHALNDAQHEA
jgi:hypothetical protein